MFTSITLLWCSTGTATWTCSYFILISWPYNFSISSSHTSLCSPDLINYKSLSPEKLINCPAQGGGSHLGLSSVPENSKASPGSSSRQNSLICSLRALSAGARVSLWCFLVAALSRPLIRFTS